jgi:hypothetical protein
MPEQTAPEFERKKWLAEHELRKADHGASKMKKFIVAAALIAAPASVVNARDNEPSREAVEEFAHQLAQDFKKQGMSLAATPPPRPLKGLGLFTAPFGVGLILAVGSADSVSHSRHFCASRR